uniref:Transcription initiation factor IIE subunit beta n=1 Tax=Strongyloides papillosus TaxID=174720 RepID=A0A0N5B6F8_STREA
MDTALISQLSQFRQAAVKNASVPQKSSTQNSYSTYTSDVNRKRKIPKPEKSEASSKSQQVSNSANFSVMARIVEFLRKRFLDKNNPLQWGLSLDEILQEMQIYDLNKKAIAWLNDNLPKNPKIGQEEPGKFIFKPPYSIKNPQGLRNLLQKQMKSGECGLLHSELAECIPDVELFISQIKKNVISIPTQFNKRKDIVYFYNDPTHDYELDEDFKALWRTIPVSHLDDRRIEEYLKKHNIKSIKDIQPKSNNSGVPKRKSRKRANVKQQNIHMDGILEEYAE